MSKYAVLQAMFVYMISKFNLNVRKRGFKYDLLQLEKDVCGARYVINESRKLDSLNVINFSTVVLNADDLFATIIKYEIQEIRVKAFELSLSVLNVKSIRDSRQ